MFHVSLPVMTFRCPSVSQFNSWNYRPSSLSDSYV